MNTTTTRRALLKAAPLAAVAVAIPIASGNAAVATSPEWDRALAAYQAADRHYEILCDRVECAEENAGEPDRIDHYFDDYKLGIGMSRESVLFWLAHYNLRSAKKIDAKRTADEFDDYQRRVLNARARSGAAELDEERLAYLPRFQSARDAVMKVPAPTVDALLVKIEIATLSLEVTHAESMLADARRLLRGEA